MKPASPVAENPARVPVLDGLRGLAILLVIFHHLTPSYLPVGDSQALYGVAWLGQRFGWVGVDLFFALSGYLITGILFDSKGAANFFRNFYVRRTLRIFPLYYAVLAGILVLLPLLFRLPRAAAFFQANAHDLWANTADIAAKQPWLWLYGANVKIAVDGGFDTLHYLGYLWTLAVEEHFYLLWPLAVFLLGRRTLLGLCGLLTVSALALRTVLVARGVDFDVPYVFTLCRMDGLAIGAAAALLVRGPGGVGRWLPLARRAAASLGLCVLVMLAVCPRRSAFVSVGGFTLTALAAAAALLTVVGAMPQSGLGRVFGGRTLRFFGRYSYGLYIVHFPFILIVGDKVMYKLQNFAGSPWLTCGIYWAMSLAASVALALAAWHLVEKPFLALKGRFPSGARPAPATDDPAACHASVPVVVGAPPAFLA